VAAFEDEHAFARAREIRGRREAVVASSNHNGVILSRHDADLIQGASRRAILVGRGGPRAVTGEGLYRLFAVRVRPEEERATRFTVSFADIGDLR